MRSLGSCYEDRPEEVRDDLERGRWDPLDLPGELIEVDLSEREQPDVAARIQT
jgi:hypothetical protein